MKYKERKIFPAEIYEKKEAVESLGSFGLNYCKFSDRLKKDKSLASMAVEKNPYAVMYMTEEMRQEPSVKNTVISKKEYLEKYIDPIGSYEKETGRILSSFRLDDATKTIEKQEKIIDKDIETEKKLQDLQAGLFQIRTR